MIKGFNYQRNLKQITAETSTFSKIPGFPASLPIGDVHTKRNRPWQEFFPESNTSHVVSQPD